MGTDNYDSLPPGTGAIACRVATRSGARVFFTNVKLRLYAAHGIKSCDEFDAKHWRKHCKEVVAVKRVTSGRQLVFPDLQPGVYCVEFAHYPSTPPTCIEIHAGCVHDACIEPDLDITFTKRFEDANCQPIPCEMPRQYDKVHYEFSIKGADAKNVRIVPPPGIRAVPGSTTKFYGSFPNPGPYRHAFTVLFGEADPPVGADPLDNPAAAEILDEGEVGEPPVTRIDGDVRATLGRTSTAFTSDVSFWQAIQNSTEALSFNSYFAYMNSLFCGDPDPESLPPFEAQRFGLKRQEFQRLRSLRLLPFTDGDAYRVVKAATEAFVMVNCGVVSSPLPFNGGADANYLQRRDLPNPPLGLPSVFTTQYLESFAGGGPGARTLPYLAVIRTKLPDIGIKLNSFDDPLPPAQAQQCHGILQQKLMNPCLLELIWSYWHEEGMLVQTMNAITRRFQNVRAPGQVDPLANLEIDPLRPLNNLLWGYLQDEQHRLTVVRRNYEYDHHYGLRLHGKAVRGATPADTRSKFLGAFHNLLRLASIFFKQDDDTTVKADAFPVLNALKEVHLILSQGAHNQFGDLPSTARVEMLMQQWFLARPELREFLPTRLMVAYPEPWMDRVDAMKKVQSWTDTSVLHFRNLAMFGEQMLLAIRYGFWSDVRDPVQAFNWARFFRPQIQGYVHAYHSVTGVDLTAEAAATAALDSTLPSVLLQKQLASQQRGI